MVKRGVLVGGFDVLRYLFSVVEGFLGYFFVGDGGNIDSSWIVWDLEN